MYERNVTPRGLRIFRQPCRPCRLGGITARSRPWSPSCISWKFGVQVRGLRFGDHKIFFNECALQRQRHLAALRPLWRGSTNKIGKVSRVLACPAFSPLTEGWSLHVVRRLGYSMVGGSDTQCALHVCRTQVSNTRCSVHRGYTLVRMNIP